MVKGKEGSLVISFLIGMNEKDEPITTKQTVRNIHGNASNDSIRVIAETLGNLVGLQVFAIEKVTRELV